MKTKKDLVDTVNRLADDFAKNPDDWENQTIDRYFDALSAWLDSARVKQTVEPSWDLMCEMLEAAKYYE